MKTNVSIKFNSIEEFQEVEQKLIELGYILLNNHIDENQKYFYIDYKYTVSTSNIIQGGYYNSLEEFLKDKNMKLTKFFKQQVDKWNEDNKCGYCYEFHAPLTEDALNKQQINDPCCVQVMLTRDRGEAFRTDRTFNNTIGIVDQQWHYKQFTLYFLLSQQESLNNYDEILGNNIEESKSVFLEDIEDCIDDLEFDFCEFIGSDWQLFQWSAFQLINYRDYNYTGYRLSVTIRKRKQF